MIAPPAQQSPFPRWEEPTCRVGPAKGLPFIQILPISQSAMQYEENVPLYRIAMYYDAVLYL
jgi:hypothetical protein